MDWCIQFYFFLLSLCYFIITTQFTRLSDLLPDNWFFFCFLIYRQILNKQIQQLEKHLQSSVVADNGPKSSFSAHNTTRDFQYETTPTFASRIDPTRLDDQFYMHNEATGPTRWNSPSVSHSSNGNISISSAPVEREPYVPKYVEVNYIDGSADKKWSKRDFPWTKKLEVCHMWHHTIINMPIVEFMVRWHFL